MLLFFYFFATTVNVRWIEKMILVDTNTSEKQQCKSKWTVEVKYGITLHTKQIIKVKELTLLHLYTGVAINHVLPQEAKHQDFLSIYRLLILIFTEN